MELETLECSVEAGTHIIHLFNVSAADMEHDNKYEQADLPHRRRCC